MRDIFGFGARASAGTSTAPSPTAEKAVQQDVAQLPNVPGTVAGTTANGSPVIEIPKKQLTPKVKEVLTDAADVLGMRTTRTANGNVALTIGSGSATGSKKPSKRMIKHFGKAPFAQAVKTETSSKPFTFLKKGEGRMASDVGYLTSPARTAAIMAANTHAATPVRGPSKGICQKMYDSRLKRKSYKALPLWQKPIYKSCKHMFSRKSYIDRIAKSKGQKARFPVFTNVGKTAPWYTKAGRRRSRRSRRSRRKSRRSSRKSAAWF